ncbi:MAG: sugar nucleotide-binding protein [Magnetococcales bacterium]|nr:sugar nucleotide-binding protein [Magnetococcales bacterium]
MASGRYLILGGSGYIGRHLYARLGPDRALATWYTHPFPGGLHFDSGSVPIADLIRGRGAFTHAFMLMGISKLLECERDKVASHRANVINAQSVIDQLRALNITPVFASTDVVFDGTRGGYREEDPTHPLVTYGQQKLTVERYLLASAAQGGIIVRLAKVYGIRRGEGTLLANWFDALTAGQEIHCADDQCFCPVFIDDVVDGLLALVERNLSGVYHLCGPTCCSRRQLLEMFLKHYVARFGPVRNPRIHYRSINAFNFSERWPLDTSMATKKLEAAIGWQPTPPDLLCQRFVAGL